MNNNDIYTHTLKPYQRKQLFYKRSKFAALYKCEEKSSFTQLQYEYKICTHLWLLRFSEKSILAVMAMWYAKHGIKPNWIRLRKEIIPKTFLFTKETNRLRRAEEYLRRKARQQAKRQGQPVLSRSAQ